MTLVGECICKPWTQGDVAQSLQLISGLQPGRHINGGDILDVMTSCAEKPQDRYLACDVCVRGGGLVHRLKQASEERMQYLKLL